MRSQLLVFLYVFPCIATALTHGSRIVLRQAAPVPSPDPCGPKVQGQQGQPTNTCNGSAIPPAPVTAPAIYANLLDNNEAAAVHPPLHSGGPTAMSPWARSCKTSINYLCNSLKNAPTEVWVSNADGVSCSASIWLPSPQKGAAPIPVAAHCMNDVFFPMLSMLDVGSAPSVNRASVNIPVGGFPSGPSTGAQIDSGYASYIIQLYVKLLYSLSHRKLKIALVRVPRQVTYFLNTGVTQELRQP